MLTYKAIRQVQEKELKKFPCGYAETNEELAVVMSNLGVTSDNELYSLDGAPFYFRASDAEAIKGINAKYDALLQEAYKDDDFLLDAIATELEEHDYKTGYPAEAVCSALGLSFEEVCKDSRMAYIWMTAMTAYRTKQEITIDPKYRTALDNVVSDNPVLIEQGKKSLTDLILEDVKDKTIGAARRFMTSIVEKVVSDLKTELAPATARITALNNQLHEIKRRAGVFESDEEADLYGSSQGLTSEDYLRYIALKKRISGLMKTTEVSKAYAVYRMNSAYKQFKEHYLNPRRYLNALKEKFEKPIALYDTFKNRLAMLKDPMKFYREMEPYRISYENYGIESLKQAQEEKTLDFLVDGIKNKLEIPANYEDKTTEKLRERLAECYAKLTLENNFLVWKDICQLLKKGEKILKETVFDENKRRERRLEELKGKGGSLNIEEKFELADLMEWQASRAGDKGATPEQKNEYNRRVEAIKTVTGSEQPAENDYIEKMRQAFQRNGGDKDPDYAVLHGTIVKHKWNETTAMSVFSQVAPNAVYDKKLAEKVMREVRKSPEYMAMKKEAATAAR